MARSRAARRAAAVGEKRHRERYGVGQQVYARRRQRRAVVQRQQRRQRRAPAAGSRGVRHERERGVYAQPRHQLCSPAARRPAAARAGSGAVVASAAASGRLRRAAQEFRAAQATLKPRVGAAAASSRGCPQR